MSDVKKEKENKITLVKMPSFTRLLVGGLVAYGLSNIMNPAFGAIALLVILIIPVLTVDNIFSKQFENAYKQPEKVVPKQVTKSDYLASLGQTPEKIEETVKDVNTKTKAKTKAKAPAQTKPKMGKSKNAV